jgi:hypothetical protein
VGLLALTVLTVAWQAVPAVREAIEQRGDTSGLSMREKELAGARSVDLDPAPIERAKSLIPAGSTFAVVTDETYPFRHEITRTSAPTFAAYWLLPSRRVSEPEAAAYVLFYGRDPRTLGVGVAEAFDLGRGVTLVRTGR